MLVRRAIKGDIPLIPAARRLQDEVLSPSIGTSTGSDDQVLGDETRAISAFKKVALMIVGTAMQTYGEKLTDQQEVLGYAANILMDTYAGESAVLRAQGAAAADPRRSDLHVVAARVFVHDAGLRVEAAARSALSAMADGDTLRTLLAALRRILKVTPVNTVALRRVLAEAAVAEGKYILGF
jgi:hypothetical protein